MQITVDEAQVELVLGRLMDTYRNNRYPYNRNDVMVPQDPRNLPPCFRDPATRDKQAYSMFLWCLCYYMRGGIKSNMAAAALGRVYEAHPDWFVAEQAMKLNPLTIEAQLPRFGLAYKAEEISRSWVLNASRLHERWQGDPRNIFQGIHTYEPVVARIKRQGKLGGFHGFREKMVSMITYFLMAEDLIEFFYFPAPVDFHVMRIFTANQLVTFADMPAHGNLLSDGLQAVIRTILEDYTRRHQISPIALCNALWLLSGNLCNEYPGNGASVGQKRNGRSTTITPIAVTWSEAQIAAYGRSCGSCPISDSCKSRILSARYYVASVIREEGPRLVPPVLFHLPSDSRMHPPTPLPQLIPARQPDSATPQPLF